MRKLLLAIGAVAAVAGLGVLIVRALDASDVVVTLTTAPAVTLVGVQPDVLGLDVTIAPPRGDRLDALFVKQEGSAKWTTDLTDAKLWADAGMAGFQGIGVDRRIATGAWNANENGWGFIGFDEPVAADGSRFFVTVTTARNPTANATVQLAIPAFRDEFAAMSYDTGDRGVFLRTARTAPVAALVNASRQTIASLATDNRPPLIRITEPKAGESFSRDWLVVRGIAQDSGGSATSRVQVGINRPGRPTVWVDATPAETGFLTWEARFFDLPRPATLELRVQGEDWVGNRSAASEPLRVSLTE